jgi:hypothetical protein
MCGLCPSVFVFAPRERSCHQRVPVLGSGCRMEEGRAPVGARCVTTQHTLGWLRFWECITASR